MRNSEGRQHEVGIGVPQDPPLHETTPQGWATRGKLPEDTTQFVAACLTVFVPETIPEDMQNLLPADEWPKVRDNFAFGLVQAIDCIRRQREATWQN